MIWGNSLGLLFFLWLPILIAIYFYRHKPKVHRVSSHFFFRKVLKNPRPRSVLEKFIESSLFWIQLLLFIILFTGLSMPSWITERTGANVVIVVDNSASMAAKDSQGVLGSQTRLNRAMNIARGWLSKRNVNSVELYSWNREIKLSQTMAGPPFTLAPLIQTHFQNGAFESLHQFSLSKKAEGASVLVVTDAMEISKQQYLLRASVDLRLVGESSDNFFIQEFEKVTLGQNKKKLRVKVGRSGDADSAEIVVSGKTGVLVRFSFSVKGTQPLWIELDCGNFEEQDLEILVKADGRDVLTEDNVWVLPKGTPQLRLGVNQEFSLINPILSRLIDLDPRLLKVAKLDVADIKIEGVRSIPKVPKPFHLYLESPILGNHRASTSHLLDNTSRFTRFLDRAVLEPASWSPNIPGDWTPLVASKSDNGAQAIILAVHKVMPSFYWNLRMKAENLYTLGLPVLWENFVREWLKLRGLSSILEVGTPMSGFKFAGSETAYTQELERLYPREFFSSGIFSRIESNERVFVRFPLAESQLGPDYLYSKVSDIESNPNPISTNNEVQLLPYLLLAATLLLIIEWTFYCRGI